jgi:hypothetical protein
MFSLLIFGINSKTMVDRIHHSNLSYETFIKEYATPPGKPLIIEGKSKTLKLGALENCIALKKWNLNYFENQIGETVVKINQKDWEE